jgi:hypothetical protein
VTPVGPRSVELPWLEVAALFGSGRDALAALVRWGVRRHGWRRVWLPSYNCPEVPVALRAWVGDEVELAAYPDAALEAPVDLDAVAAAAGDVVVVVNQLGIRPRPDIGQARRRGLVVVEDHSHDPGSSWALESAADFAFASLRKTLPIPDGGAVWSPLGLELPPEPRAGSGGERLAAALLTRGHRPATDQRLIFRALARSAAGSPEPMPGAAISRVSRALLPQMPIRAWRQRRRDNLNRLAEAVTTARGVRVPSAPAGGVPFALSLVFDDAEHRAAVRQALIARAVVPAVLWPLNLAGTWGARPADADLSSRILCVHADQRFDADDMRALAAILSDALGG